MPRKDKIRAIEFWNDISESLQNMVNSSQEDFTTSHENDEEEEGDDNINNDDLHKVNNVSHYY